jgi:hypothetical protein
MKTDIALALAALLPAGTYTSTVSHHNANNTILTIDLRSTCRSPIQQNHHVDNGVHRLRPQMSDSTSNLDPIIAGVMRGHPRQ